MKKQAENKYDFTPIGKAIKANRLSKELTQENVAEAVGLELPYYSTIENNGQHPSFQVLHDIVQLLHVSVDEFLIPQKNQKKTSRRNAVDDLLNQLSDSELIIVEGTIKGILDSKRQ